jgi:hypothetical protein
MSKCVKELYRVTSEPTKQQIKQAFCICAKRHHPDVGGDTETFKQCVKHKPNPVQGINITVHMDTHTYNRFFGRNNNECVIQ